MHGDPCGPPGEWMKVPSNAIYSRILDGRISLKKDEGMKCYLFPEKLSKFTQIGQLLDGEIS
jgi:hypothetical protein